MKEYHDKLEFDWPTIETLKHFPCHYGLLDAFWSADSLLGLKEDYSPVNTKTIIGGEDILAVAWVGAKKMGLDPYKGSMFEKAAIAFDLPDVDWIGDQTVYEKWNNVPPFIDRIVDVGEEGYVYANWLGFISSKMDPAFPPKTRHHFSIFIRRIATGFLGFLSRYDRFKIFVARTPVGAAGLDEIEIDHRYAGIVRPLTKAGIVNIFDLVSTNPNYRIEGLLGTGE